jgi:hypothetical protein
MNRVGLLTILLGVMLVFGTVSAAAGSENGAIVVKEDIGCKWWSYPLRAFGSMQYVRTSNGKWTLSCHGTISKGLPIDSAVQLRSTDRNPKGLCETPLGDTNNWHMTFSPSGKSSFVCHGEVTK